MYTFTMCYTYIFLHIQLPFQVCQMPKITFQFQNGQKKETPPNWFIKVCKFFFVSIRCWHAFIIYPPLKNKNGTRLHV